MSLPTYEPGLQAQIDQSSAEIRSWIEELSPGTVEWMREDDAFSTTLRAVLADCAGSDPIDVRVLGWIQLLTTLRMERRCS